MKTSTRFICGIVILCALLLLSADSRAQVFSKAESAKNLIVKVTGENIQGSGIVFGQQGSVLFIATANHVVRPGRQDVEDLRVEFAFWPEALEAKLSGKFDRQLDLALLMVNLEESFLSETLLKEALPLSQEHYARDIGQNEKVYPIGHPPAQDWFVPPAAALVTAVEGEKIQFYFQCDQGYSGGGLFNERWDLVGMIRAFNPPLCQANSFHRLQATLKKWRAVVSLQADPEVQATRHPTPKAEPTKIPQPKPTDTPEAQSAVTLEPSTAPIAGQEYHDPISGIDFVRIPAGCFQMGCVSGLNCLDDELPAHEVCLDSFWLGKTEVTQAQWKAVLDNNPSQFEEDTQPVGNVSWDDSQKFFNALNEQAGQEIYRLPSEAEWEYAARAGSQTKYSFGNDAAELDKYAWHGAMPEEATQPVGQLRPNAWGLFDMHGNVWEWCRDWYKQDYYAESPTENPSGPKSGTDRVFRGGAVDCGAQSCRSATRSWGWPEIRDRYIGLRVAVDGDVW